MDNKELAEAEKIRKKRIAMVGAELVKAGLSRSGILLEAAYSNKKVNTEL